MIEMHDFYSKGPIWAANSCNLWWLRKLYPCDIARCINLCSLVIIQAILMFCVKKYFKVSTFFYPTCPPLGGYSFVSCYEMTMISVTRFCIKFNACELSKCSLSLVVWICYKQLDLVRCSLVGDKLKVKILHFKYFF